MSLHELTSFLLGTQLICNYNLTFRKFIKHSRFRDDTTAEVMDTPEDTPEHCATIQNDLKRLEKLAKRNPELLQIEVQKML